MPASHSRCYVPEILYKQDKVVLEYRFLTNQDLDKLRAGSQYISKARWDALDFSASKRRRQNWRDYAMCHSVSTEDFEKALARPSTDPLRERPIMGGDAEASQAVSGTEESPGEAAEEANNSSKVAVR